MSRIIESTPDETGIIALDTESTGLDVFHGAMPWLVSVSDRVDVPPRVWQWPVDPVTRRVQVNQEDVEEIQRVLNGANEIVGHNIKFDAHMMRSIGVSLQWDKVRDTLMTSHLLASNHSHNLTDTVLEYLGVDIHPLEREMAVAVKACRKSIKSNSWVRYGVDCTNWRLAEKGLSEMPSVGGSDDDSPWKNDMWVAYSLTDALLSAGVDLEDVQFPESWLSMPLDYARADPAVTLAFWLWAQREVYRLGLRSILADRTRLVKVAYDLECHGVTISKRATDTLIAEYTEAVNLHQAECMCIADQYDFDLELPNGAAPNDSLKEFIWGSIRLECPKCGTVRKHKKWVDGPLDESTPICKKCASKKGRLVLQRDHRGKPVKNASKVLIGGPEIVECVVVENECLGLPYVYNEKTVNPTLDKSAIEHYCATLLPGTALEFVEHISGMRSRQTATTYMNAYSRYWLPVGDDNFRSDSDGWFRIHSHANPTATDTLRWGFSDPNTSNISDKEDFSLRRCFGPMPGREWWKMDFKSIERRIPAYESKEPKMIEVFEHPKEPPYWGNLYCLTASVLYPEQYWPLADTNGAFRRAHPVLYKRAKFFDLAKQYGCGKRKGDLLSGVIGSSDMIDDSFPLLTELQQHYLNFAERYGYVETIPDREVCAERGYPILAARNENGRVSPTTPFCYHVSGTAMQCTNRAMIKTETKIKQWNAEGWDGFLTLQVHDELVWDCPCGSGDKPWEMNLRRMDELKETMESVGNAIGIPTPVSREYCLKDYASGVPI